MITLTLLGTEHCHLCDEAEHQLESNRLFSKIPYNYQVKDIIDDEELFATYRKEIPVVVNEATGEVLKHPFGIVELMALLEGS